jgi:hypothetical protein
MSPFAHAGPPADLAPSLEVRLKEGWRLAPDGKAFVAADGRRHPIKGELPPRSRLVPQVPSLAAKEPAALSADERFLARRVQVILPKGHDAADYLKVVRAWEPVEEVRLPPRVGLP